MLQTNISFQFDNYAYEASNLTYKKIKNRTLHMKTAPLQDVSICLFKVEFLEKYDPHIFQVKRFSSLSICKYSLELEFLRKGDQCT